MYSDLDVFPGRNLTLKELSFKRSMILLPSIVYLTILAIIGVFGNGLVIVVFYSKFRPSIYRCFILTLSGVDFLSCFIGTPWTIAEAFNVYTYYDAISCKLFRFLLYTCSFSSSLTLVLIAIERHRKICYPLKQQLTIPWARRLLVLISGILAVVIAAPVLLLYGNSTVYTQSLNITGTKCFLTDEMLESIWPAVFNIYVLVLATISFLIMSVCYFKVARRVAYIGKESIQKRTMKTAVRSNQSRSSADDTKSEQEVETDIGSDETSVKTTESSQTPSGLSRASPVLVKRMLVVQSKTKKLGSKVMRRLSGKSGKTARITKMLIAISVAFILSVFPHLVLMIWSTVVGETASRDRFYPKDNVYQVVFYSFMINNLINPIIYGVMDLKFRRESKRILLCGILKWQK